MEKISSDILLWIGDNKVTMDELHEYIHKQLGNSYEIGDAGIVVNEMIASRLLDVDESNNVYVIG